MGALGVQIGREFAGAQSPIYRDGAVVANPTARDHRNRTMKGWKKLTKADPGEAARRTEAIIKNKYRTLMTRGMKGCNVHATDPASRDHLGSRLQARQGQR